MDKMARSVQRFFANNHMDILLVTWYTLHLPLLILFIILNVGYYYFAALVLITSGIYHLVKRKCDRKSLATYFVLTIIGYVFIIAVLLNLKQPDPVMSAGQDSRWLVAAKLQPY
jgi:Kef-type K+ transport system membrane component KefB